MAKESNPLVGRVPSQVPLKNAPLATVLCQIRFPPSLLINETIGKFQSLIQDSYPELRMEQVIEVVMSPSGPPQVQPSPIWRFFDSSRDWTVSVTSSFVSIQTKSYESRDDFIRRLNDVLVSASKSFGIKSYGRVGVRYIDQIRGDELVDLEKLVTPALTGMLNAPFSDCIEQSLSQVVLDLPEPPKAKMFVRYGLVAKDTTYDPGALMPINERSWVLDIDLFREFSDDETLAKFDPETLAETVRKMSERIYSFFRWAVTSEFLSRYRD